MIVGRLILEKWERDVARVVKESYRFALNGLNVACLEGVHYSSDAAESIGTDADVVIAFSYKTENNERKLIYSTRSKTNFNCADFAKRFGGGGHTKAAGFSLPVNPADANPYEEIYKRLVEYWST